MFYPMQVSRQRRIPIGSCSSMFSFQHVAAMLQCADPFNQTCPHEWTQQVYRSLFGYAEAIPDFLRTQAALGPKQLQGVLLIGPLDLLCATRCRYFLSWP